MALYNLSVNIIRRYNIFQLNNRDMYLFRYHDSYTSDYFQLI